MLIKSVELQNIKSYVHEIIEMSEGINGICGMNGNGKTTILEAIGYVLFDYLPYSEKDFKRKGESSAYVTIEIILNELSYKLTRKLGGTFTIKGQDIDITGKKDAIDWITHNLFTSSTPDDLQGIFENAIGVPQGMFTTAFSYTATKRQKIFDEILKVDEYRKAFDNLRDTTALIENNIKNIENDITGLRIRTEHHEENKIEKENLNIKIENLKISLVSYNSMLNSAKTTLETLKKQKEELDKLNGEINQLNTKLEGQNQQLKKTKDELVRAEEAQNIISGLSGMKEKYNEARRNLEKLDELRKNREVLIDKLNKIQNVLSLFNDKKIQINLLKADTDKKTDEKNTLLPFVNEQVELENKRVEANQKRAIAMKEIDGIKNKMTVAGTGNICPVMIGIACKSVTDFSGYFKEQLSNAENNLNAILISINTLESRLSVIGDVRNKINYIEICIKNNADVISRHINEMGTPSEKENEATLLKIELEKFKTIDEDLSNAKTQIKELEPLYLKLLQNQAQALRVIEYKKECEILQKSIDDVNEKLKSLQIHVKEICNSFNDTDFTKAQSTYEDIITNIKGFQVEINEKENHLQRLTKELLEAEAYFKDIRELEARLENEIHFRDYAKFIRETLRDSGQYIVIELIKEISDDANNLYGSIMDDFSQELQWSEDYEIKIIDNGEEKIFQQLSGGEKMSAALAVRLALLKNLSNSDFVFLDEPTQNMDEIRRENLSEQITKIKGFKQVFVISHDDTFNEKYSHVIKVQKINGESKVIP
jgi:DNA repair protein SbcC/Rad50